MHTVRMFKTLLDTLAVNKCHPISPPNHSHFEVALVDNHAVEVVEAAGSLGSSGKKGRHVQILERVLQKCV